MSTFYTLAAWFAGGTAFLSLIFVLLRKLAWTGLMLMLSGGSMYLYLAKHMMTLPTQPTSSTRHILTVLPLSLVVAGFLLLIISYCLKEWSSESSATRKRGSTRLSVVKSR